jgi:hypothetical protein
MKLPGTAIYERSLASAFPLMATARSMRAITMCGKPTSANPPALWSRCERRRFRTDNVGDANSGGSRRDDTASLENMAGVKTQQRVTSSSTDRLSVPGIPKLVDAPIPDTYIRPENI